MKNYVPGTDAIHIITILNLTLCLLYNYFQKVKELGYKVIYLEYLKALPIRNMRNILALCPIAQKLSPTVKFVLLLYVPVNNFSLMFVLTDTHTFTQSKNNMSLISIPRVKKT